MKQKTFLSLVLALVAALTIFLTWWFSSSQVLLRRSSSLISCIQMEPDTGRIQRAFKTEKLSDLITHSVLVSYPQMKSTFTHSRSSNAPITLGKERAKSALLHLTEMAEWITVENEALEIQSAHDSSAVVLVDFDLSAKLKGQAVKSSTMKGEFHFQKVGSKWLVAKVLFE